MAIGSTNLEVVFAGWIDARRRNDVEALERHLHPDVVWQGLRDDLVCPDRAHVLDNVRAASGQLPEVEGIELSATGDQVLFGVRSPDFTELFGEHLDGELFTVFTIRDGLIVRMEEFKTREAAEQAMSAHRETLLPAAAPGSRSPSAPVGDLIAFVHVADVARSIAFYELLGFDVSDTHGPRSRPDWAALEAQNARLMLAQGDKPIDPARQGVVFYLYAPDLRTLQQHLRAHGARVGGIRDGSPGPKREMVLRDPDGYMLMVAQIDDDNEG
jgi:catechol 2,3-dioxygenase-like lactoylglutathione lyase family enzyme/ketosteroid isomerase-like protein